MVATTFVSQEVVRRTKYKLMVTFIIITMFLLHTIQSVLKSNIIVILVVCATILFRCCLLSIANKANRDTRID